MGLSSRKLICLLVLVKLCSGIRHESETENFADNTELVDSSSRQSKNLFPFVWVTFKPSPCGGTNKDGVCVQRGKCRKQGGETSAGECQDGFGECCVFEARCNGTKTQVYADNLVTRLVSPDVANQECVFKFKKEPNICQIKLDFVTFTSMGASENGDCETDRITISNSITVNNGFTTCGMLTGQHMYLTFGSQDTIDVSPFLRSVSGNSYNIIATRIPCDSPNRAPDYCLQYFTKPSDCVRSFDFGRQQQNNQLYNVCVKPMPSSQSVRWSPCSAASPTCNPGNTNPFNIVYDYGLPRACDEQTDWIQVRGMERKCLSFQENTASTFKPYDILVNFNDHELPPPPTWFTKPIDGPCDDTVGTGNCNYMPDLTWVTCGCVATAPVADTCQCTISPGFAPTADFNNTGFCLEYNQQ